MLRQVKDPGHPWMSRVCVRLPAFSSFMYCGYPVLHSVESSPQISCVACQHMTNKYANTNVNHANHTCICKTHFQLILENAIPANIRKWRNDKFHEYCYSHNLISIIYCHFCNLINTWTEDNKKTTLICFRQKYTAKHLIKIIITFIVILYNNKWLQIVNKWNTIQYPV